MSRRPKHFLKHSESGFTIVELMIALSVLSVLLLISSATLLEIGKMYSKGVNAATVQDTTRNIINEVSSALEFGGSEPAACTDYTPTTVDNTGATVNAAPTCAADHHAYSMAGVGTLDVYSYCIDTTRYNYVIDKQVVSSVPGANQTYHALWRDTMSTNASCNALDLTTPGTPSDAATKPGTTGAELVPQRMALTRFFTKETAPGDGLYSVRASVAYGDFDLMRIDPTGTVLCQGSSGQEYCATSRLDTVVTRRLK